ncbi:MAG: UDP-N-acetylmuramate dehydrogenase, partial [Oscillospiraceae bacterium]|nr:UDP-N-acetylmuramate dehydrogenase [Oscillospiraceae bacterium]
MSIDSIRSICGDRGAVLLENTPIAPYTSFKIGGNCNIVRVNKFETLRAVLKQCKADGFPYHILGKGSNVLISDKGLSGVVLLISDGFGLVDADGEIIICQAGARLSDICKTALMHSLTGMEFAYGIPGTAGGALYMNAGAYGSEMSDVVESCSYIDDELLRESKKMATADMKLSYRHSVFAENPDMIITKVKIRLRYGNRSEIKAKMDEISDARMSKQPLDYPSAGSTFKRPEGHFAAKLIDDCGLRGKQIGNAAVSEKHAGFIINKGGATFDDVVRLIDFVKE